MRIPPARLLAVACALTLAACSSGSAGSGGGWGPAPATRGARVTNDPRIPNHMGQALPAGGGGQWMRPMATAAPRVIFYQFAFPG